MHSDVVYIANAQVKPDLPEFDMNEIPPLPAFQGQSAPVIEQGNDVAVPNNTIILVALIIVVIVFVSLIGLYIKLKKQSSVAISSISNLKAVTKKIKSAGKTDKFKKQDKSKQSSPVGAINSEFDETNFKNNELHSIKLGTPASVQKCIKVFFKSTLDEDVIILSSLSVIFLL